MCRKQRDGPLLMHSFHRRSCVLSNLSRFNCFITITRLSKAKTLRSKADHFAPLHLCTGSLNTDSFRTVVIERGESPTISTSSPTLHSPRRLPLLLFHRHATLPSPKRNANPTVPWAILPSTLPTRNRSRHRRASRSLVYQAARLTPATSPPFPTSATMLSFPGAVPRPAPLAHHQLQAARATASRARTSRTTSSNTSTRVAMMAPPK